MSACAGSAHGRAGSSLQVHGRWRSAVRRPNFTSDARMRPGAQRPHGTAPARSLELPSLGFGRKRRAKKAAARPRAGAVLPEAAPGRRPHPAPAPARPRPRPTPEPARAAGPARRRRPARQPLFTDEARAPERRCRRRPGARPPRPAAARRSPGWARCRRRCVTGLLVGVITVGLVWASQRLCEVLRGTSSCGDAGFLLLLAVLVLAGLARRHRCSRRSASRTAAAPASWRWAWSPSC